MSERTSEAKTSGTSMSDLERGEKPEPTPEDNIVTWDGPNDPSNPKNWPFARRWLATGLVSLITFMTPMASSIIAPAEDALSQDLHITSDFMLSLIFSIFLLAFIIGPLFIAPMSEVYGRVIVLQLANCFFLAFNLACGFAQNQSEMLAFRFLSGLGACAPQTVGGGVLSDLWRSEERGLAVALYSLAPLLGPTLGPLMGAWITERTTWRWCFWMITIFGVTVQVLVFFTLKETYGPRILYWKAEKMRKETGNEDLRTEYELDERTFGNIMKTAISRPFILLFTQPIVMFLAGFLSLIYGIVYIMLNNFPAVWTDIYHESLGIGGLHYIALALGMAVGAQTGGKALDWGYKKLKARSPDGQGRPEYRVPILFIATALLSGGLVMFGWGAQFRVFWLVPDIGAALFGCGMTLAFTAIQTYTIDAYTVFAASAIGTTAVARSATGFGFPLFANAMYDSLGQGWGNSVLALAILLIGYPGSCVLWFYGDKLRARSTFATDPASHKEDEQQAEGSEESEEDSEISSGEEDEHDARQHDQPQTTPDMTQK